ncbi:Type I restriction-modification system [Francisella orientalis]|uniref:Type I restriction-modification system n=1 Tax=Francisella orientalis TaxID=299583 RepID=A0ABM5U624_9GAMM|nr:type I restriction-modification system, subunit R (restriction) [Francisella orientalis str. Toba 04]AKN85431.1 Type I restriction-modification system [Francisella orientalis FNO12]AKN86970.1 Type I restriction-modification system [Francisella orientalis FNO24]AKN88508.1 Type I restriction-modification system [Francisella orientalis]AKU05264.1 Type I restriction-modification system [Francisella orientalis]
MVGLPLQFGIVSELANDFGGMEQLKEGYLQLQREIYRWVI